MSKQIKENNYERNTVELNQKSESERKIKKPRKMTKEEKEEYERLIAKSVQMEMF